MQELVQLNRAFSRSFWMPCASFSMLEGPGGIINIEFHDSQIVSNGFYAHFPNIQFQTDVLGDDIWSTLSMLAAGLK